MLKKNEFQSITSSTPLAVKFFLQFKLIIVLIVKENLSRTNWESLTVSNGAKDRAVRFLSQACGVWRKQRTGRLFLDPQLTRHVSPWNPLNDRLLTLEQSVHQTQEAQGIVLTTDSSHSVRSPFYYYCVFSFPLLIDTMTRLATLICKFQRLSKNLNRPFGSKTNYARINFSTKSIIFS